MLKKNQFLFYLLLNLILVITIKGDLNEESVKEVEVKAQAVNESEVNESEVNEPEVNEPEVKEPEVQEPEVKETEVNEPEVNEPEVNESEVNEPEVKELEEDEQEIKEPVESKVKESEVKEPEVQDYFYDAEIGEEEVKKRQQEEKLKKSQEALSSTEKPPEFFENNKQDESDKLDWNKFYMEKIIGEYMKKMQQEQLEKRKLKSKSDLNHPILSVITLTTFFGTGIFIGVIIICVRGRQFQKNKDHTKNKTDKKEYQPVQLDEHITA